MFREYSAQNRVLVLDSPYWMNPYVKEELERTWTHVIYENVFWGILAKDYPLFSTARKDRQMFLQETAISIEFKRTPQSILTMN